MDIATRFETNPIITPADVSPSLEGLTVECVLNPGAFRWDDKTWLLLRVAERQIQREGFVGTPVCDPSAPSGLKLLEFATDDPKMTDFADPRKFVYDGVTYLTTISHLRLASSEDGEAFVVNSSPTLTGVGPMERFGVEDCRVSQVDETYLLTYTAVSEVGYGVGLAGTRDWRTFERLGMIIPPANKDCAIFEEKINGSYYCLHRPSPSGMGGPFIWVGRSDNLRDWGEHECIARTRPGMWDSRRIGPGAAPVRTGSGWLEIYHGVDDDGRYCLGALLLDIDDPTRVLARSDEPIMEPIMEYEQKGFFGNVVFTNGHVRDGDRITLYYGASDTVVCGAYLSIKAILAQLARSR